MGLDSGCGTSDTLEATIERAVERSVQRVVDRAIGQLGIGEISPLLITRNQACEVLAISERTLDRLAKSGEIKPMRIGRSIRYHLDEIRRFVDEQKSAS